MRFERYECYKDSGLEWLGEIPCEWGVKRLKDIFKYFGSGSTPLSTNKQYYDDGIIPWLNTTDIRNNIVNSTKYKISKLAFSKLNMKIYPKNSLAIGMYGQGETRGNVAILNIEVTTNQNAGIMSKFINSDSKFIFWWFIGRKKHIRQIGNVATIPNLNKDIIRNLFIALPPLKTQTKITTYLDTKTKKIDKEIALLEQKIEKYRELKQTLINETVLRGLDRGVEFKDSGIEWIGEIPKGWKLTRFEDILHKKKKKNNSLLDCGSISFGTIVLKNSNKIPIETKESYQEVLVGEFLINPLNLNFDLKSFRTAISTLDVVVSSGYIVLQSKKNIHKYYLRWLLHQFDISQMKTLSAGVRHTIHYDDIAKSLFYMPSIKEQIQISNYLDEKTQKIDNITQTISKKIELLKEFRKTLINDVVTGRVKVDKNEI